MDTESEKVRLTLLNLVANVERSLADIRIHVRETLLLSETEDLDLALLHIEDLTVELERLALLSKEVVPDERVRHNEAEATVEPDDVVPGDWIPPNGTDCFDSQSSAPPILSRLKRDYPE